MYLVVDKESGKSSKLEFKGLINHSNIKDSYILWDLSLVRNSKLEHMTIVQYYFMESLEKCLSGYGYSLVCL